MRPTLGIAALLASVMMLSGCAIPIGVQIAKWSLDGISYVTTQKSISDHGLSLITGEDCAVHRIVTRGEICSEYDDVGKIVVDLETGPNDESIADFDTAAGLESEIEATPASIESRLNTKEPILLEARIEKSEQAIR